jgi:hypothetical protein
MKKKKIALCYTLKSKWLSPPNFTSSNIHCTMENAVTLLSMFHKCDIKNEETTFMVNNSINTSPNENWMENLNEMNFDCDFMLLKKKLKTKRLKLSILK